MSNLLQLKNITKAYDKNTALENISLNIGFGEFITLYGPSGSGKSTLLNLIGLIDRLYQGDIFFNNVNIKNILNNDLSKTRLHDIGFVFQDFNLIDTLTVEENILIALWGHKNFDTLKVELDNLLSLLDILSIKHMYPNMISGGQKQRVAIARAFIKKPLLIVADEPTANLDSKNASIILEYMKKLSSGLNITVIISTHDLNIINQVEKKIKIVDGSLECQYA